MRYVIDDILYALAAELGDRDWFDLTGPEKSLELIEEAKFLAQHDPLGYVEREFYKRQEPVFKNIHSKFEEALINQVMNDPKKFFESNVWRKPTIVKALGENAGQKLQYLIRGAARNLIRQDPMAALMEYKLHHYEPFREFFVPLREALRKGGNQIGFRPEDKEVQAEWVRLNKEIEKS